VSDSTLNIVLVTGADGFIGSVLCRHLLAAGYQVRALVRKLPGAQSPVDADGLEYAIGDVRDSSQLDAVMAGVKYVFHLAGIAHVDEPDPDLLEAVTVQGTANVVAAAQRAGVERLVYFSSSLALRAEKHLPDASEYGRAKLQAEQLIRRTLVEGKPDFCILRPVNVYGVGMAGNLAQMIRMIAGRRLPPLPRLPGRLSLVSVTDLCAAALLAAHTPAASGRTYTVTDGQIYLINELEESIYQALGRQKPAWVCPRVILYAGVVAVGLWRKLLGPGKHGTAVARRSYNSLLQDNLASNQVLLQELKFKPGTTFYSELPELVATLLN